MTQTRFPNRWHPDDPVKLSIVKREYMLDFPWDRVSKDTKKDLEKGRLSMKCPYCSATSIAGPWCFKCYRMVPPENWHPVEAKGRGRPRKVKD
jgi:hypothetical protein